MTDYDRGSSPKTEQAQPSASSRLPASQQSVLHLASAGTGDQKEPRDTPLPRIKLYRPDHSTTVFGQPEKAVAASSLSPDSAAAQPMTLKPTELLRPRRRFSTGLRQMHQRKITPEEAHKALQAVIGYCKQRATGFLDFQESVLLGKLDERLRSMEVDIF